MPRPDPDSAHRPAAHAHLTGPKPSPAARTPTTAPTPPPTPPRSTSAAPRRWPRPVPPSPRPAPSTPSRAPSATSTPGIFGPPHHSASVARPSAECPPPPPHTRAAPQPRAAHSARPPATSAAPARRATAAQHRRVPRGTPPAARAHQSTPVHLHREVNNEEHGHSSRTGPPLHTRDLPLRPATTQNPALYDPGPLG